MSGNSADRRRERRAANRRLRSDLVFFCLAGAMAIALWLVPHRTTFPTVLGLALLAVFLIIPVWHFSIIRKAPAGLSRNLSQMIGALVVLLCVAYFGTNVWPAAGIGELTPSQRDRFMAKLKTQSDPILIHLMCPPNDERDCTVASQFVTLFRTVRWQVRGNMVDRVAAGNPRTGLYFVLHSTVDPDPGNPEGKTGAWTKLPRAYFTVKDAFDELTGSHRKWTDTGNDLEVGLSYPDDELGIYFGLGTAGEP